MGGGSQCGGLATCTHAFAITHTFDSHSHRAGMPRLELAPITGSLPRSLWPHDVVVWVRSSARGVYDDAGSLRGIRRSQGKSAPRRRGLFIENPFPALCKDAQRRRTTSRSAMSQSKLTTQLRPLPSTTTSRRGSQRRAAPAVQDNNNEVRGRTGRQSMMGRYRQSDRWTSSLRRKQKEGVWPPEKRLRGRQRGASRVVDFFDQLQRAPPIPMSDQWGAHDIPPPSGVRKTGAVRWEIIVAPTTSTGGQGPSRWRDFGGPGDRGRG